MIRVQTNDGELFEDVSAEAVVRRMRSTEWGAPTRKRDWMIEVCDRVEQMSGEALPNPATVPAREFLAYVERSGLIFVSES